MQDLSVALIKSLAAGQNFVLQQQVALLALHSPDRY